MKRENPSRRAEAVARAVVQSWVAEAGRVSDGGKDLVDFRIQYSDGRWADGEVKVDFDEAKQKQWSALMDLPTDQLVELPPGTGAWMAVIKPAAVVRSVVRALPPLIAEMKHRDQIVIDLRWGFGESPLTESLTGLGIEMLESVEGASGDQCVLFTQARAGLVPTDANLTIDWVHGCFLDSRFANSWHRLATSHADERHAFLWIGDGVNEDLARRIQFHPESPPEIVPTLPPWLTHLWVGIPWSFATRDWTWLCRPEVGWIALADLQQNVADDEE